MTNVRHLAALEGMTVSKNGSLYLLSILSFSVQNL